MDGSRSWQRHAALAFLAGTTAALIIDALLQTALAAVSVASLDSSPPWWVTANLIPRGRWVAYAVVVLAAVTLGFLRDQAPCADTAARAIWHTVGRALILLPVLWVFGTWIVNALVFTVAARWDIDGRIFLEASYYRHLFADYVPWLLAGAVVIAAGRHVE